MNAHTLLASGFATLPDLVHAHARERADQLALAEGATRLSWGEVARQMDRIAARLQADGLQEGDTIAIAGLNSVPYVLVMLGALRAGVTAALITSSATGDQIAAMITDCGARHLFLDRAVEMALGERACGATIRIALDDGASGPPWSGWIDAQPAPPRGVTITPETLFNIIYSSGTTGQPKGIVQAHGMRWQHVLRGAPAYGPTAVTLLSTPLYSNTTMAAFVPALGTGGTIWLMRRFDVAGYLALAERERVTNTMLVPIQYRRILAHPDFDRYDLSAFRVKYCTSAPFPPALKAEVLARWPGGLVEIYGLTEGGCAFLLEAHKYPDKLGTVGRAAPGHRAKIIDEDGRELPPGSVGEIVGHSPAMMTGYHNRPDATEALVWRDADGTLFYRQGDIGRIDADGFLTLMDRAKDMIISGGFNIYPSDLEAVLMQDARVIDCAVLGAPSEEWGETPVGFVVLKPGTECAVVLDNANAKVGRTQRLSRLIAVEELPRSPIGKVLKRALRDQL